MRLRTSQLLLLAGVSGAATAASSCKVLPGDEHWPAQQEWSSLNQTVGGRLIATIPVASQCHTGGPFNGLFNATACDLLRTWWNFSQAHYPFPAEVSFPWLQNQTCDPFTPKNKSCEIGNLASYSISVSGAADVVAGINFAKKNNVRLVIKNTGHDYLGKSTGKGGLALWTHNLKSIEVIKSYNSSYYTGQAIKLGAGVQAFEAYEAANATGHRVVGGTCATVGIAGGYSMGGGHSTLSSIYGLSADNVLEWEVVTGAGEHLTATPEHNSDLYWALSGGGGGTYSVVLSMTTRLHPDGSVAGAYLQFNDSQVGNDRFWEAVGTVQPHLPAILATGTSLLYSMYERSFSIFSLTAPGKTAEDVATSLRPILADLESRNVSYTFSSHVKPNFIDHFAQDLGPLPYGPFSAGQVTGSRLIPRAVLTDAEKNRAVTRAMRDTVRSGDFFIACQALDVSRNVSRVANAVLPAWRDAASHCIVVGYWDYERPRAEMEAKEAVLTNVISPALEAVTPGSGTYLNEANFRQKNFQQHFYGANYGKLLDIKKKYDPDSIFYATTAVGSDAFVVDDSGRLCRA